MIVCMVCGSSPDEELPDAIQCPCGRFLVEEEGCVAQTDATGQPPSCFIVMDEHSVLSIRIWGKGFEFRRRSQERERVVALALEALCLHPVFGT